MINTLNPLNENSNFHDKDTHFKNEMQTIFSYLKNNVCTASMLSDATGIKQKNITRYKRDLESYIQLCSISFALVTGTAIK